MFPLLVFHKITAYNLALVQSCRLHTAFFHISNAELEAISITTVDLNYYRRYYRLQNWRENNIKVINKSTNSIGVMNNTKTGDFAPLYIYQLVCRDFSFHCDVIQCEVLRDLSTSQYNFSRKTLSKLCSNWTKPQVNFQIHFMDYISLH